MAPLPTQIGNTALIGSNRLEGNALPTWHCVLEENQTHSTPGVPWAWGTLGSGLLGHRLARQKGIILDPHGLPTEQKPADSEEPLFSAESQRRPSRQSAFSGCLLAKAPESPELAWSGAKSYRTAPRTVLTRGLVRPLSVGKGLKSGNLSPPGGNRKPLAPGHPEQLQAKSGPSTLGTNKSGLSSTLLPSTEEVH